MDTCVSHQQRFSPTMADEDLEASPSVDRLPKFIRSLSSKLRRFARRDDVAQEMRVVAAGDPQLNWLPYDSCHIIACFGIQGKAVRQASSEIAQDGSLARAGKDYLTTGVSPADHCVDVDVDEAIVGSNSPAIAEMHTSRPLRDSKPGGLHQYGCFASVNSGPTTSNTTVGNGWLRDEDVDYYTAILDSNYHRIAEIHTSHISGDEEPGGLQQCGCSARVGSGQTATTNKGNRLPRDEGVEYHKALSFNWEKSTEPLRETMRVNPGQLGPSKSNEESLSGRQQCGCLVNSSISRLKKEWGSRKSEKVERREGIPTDEDSSLIEQGQPALPDDVVELCLTRMTFRTLARARMVCRKWRDLTMSPHFLSSREKLLSRKPWLLLFGLSRSGISRGEIHALDTSSNRWHSIQADILSGRLLFSVASLNGLVYVLGGCSSLSNGDGKPGKGTVKTHKGVLLYNPFTYSWSEVCSMGFARAMAVTGVFEIKGGGMVRGTGKSQGAGSCQCEAENGGFCNVGKTVNTVNQTPILNHSCRNPGEPGERQKRSGTQAKWSGLIVVGGQGLWNQPLYSAEIYEPLTNTWREVARLPADHGITCAGVVCNGLFYAYSETDKLAAYDFNLNIWIKIQVSNTLTRLHEYIPKLVSCNGKLVLFGVAWGSRDRGTDNVANGTRNDAEAATRVLWEFCPTSQTWREFAKHPDAPLDWNAVSVCEGNQIYGLEMFKIFGQVLDFVTVCDLSGSEAIWKRMSRMRLGNDLDVSSCITKAAVVVQL